MRISDIMAYNDSLLQHTVMHLLLVLNTSDPSIAKAFDASEKKFKGMWDNYLTG